MAIIKLYEHQPHVVIRGKVSTHVVPEALLWDVIERKKRIEDIEDYEDFLPELIKDWLFDVPKG